MCPGVAQKHVVAAPCKVRHQSEFFVAAPSKLPPLGHARGSPPGIRHVRGSVPRPRLIEGICAALEPHDVESSQDDRPQSRRDSRVLSCHHGTSMAAATTRATSHARAQTLSMTPAIATIAITPYIVY